MLSEYKNYREDRMVGGCIVMDTHSRVIDQ